MLQFPLTKCLKTLNSNTGGCRLRRRDGFAWCDAFLFLGLLGRRIYGYEQCIACLCDGLIESLQSLDSAFDDTLQNRPFERHPPL